MKKLLHCRQGRFTMTMKDESMQVFKDVNASVLAINARDQRAAAAFALTEVICVYEQEARP